MGFINNAPCGQMELRARFHFRKIILTYCSSRFTNVPYIVLTCPGEVKAVSSKSKTQRTECEIRIIANILASTKRRPKAKYV
jgi:hypothetical protein